MIYIVDISKLNVFWHCRNSVKGYYNEYLVLFFYGLFLLCYQHIFRLAYKPQGCFIVIMMTADTWTSHVVIATADHGRLWCDWAHVAWQRSTYGW